MSENVRNLFEVDGKQARALGALIAGSSLADAAATAGVSTRQLLRWRGEPDFAEVLAAARAAMLEDVARQAARLAGAALQNLGAIMGNEEASANDRIKAASVVLSTVLPFNGDARAQDRIREIEARLQQGR